MDEVEFDVKELFHFINTHTDEFFIRVRFDEEGGLCGETDRCGSGEISEGWDDYESEADYDAYRCGGTSWGAYV